MSLSIVIIGSGNVGYHLALAFNKSKISIAQVYNRSRNGLSRISKQTGVRTTTSFSRIVKTADVYILAINDDAIANVAADLKQFISPKSFVVHTSGNQKIEVLGPYFSNCGCLYPLQSFKINRKVNFDEIPIFTTSSNDLVSRKLKKIAESISNNVISIKDEDRAKLHIPAVFVNNFTNHFFTHAYDFCSAEGLDFNHLLPLIQETVNRITDQGIPSKLQTGPAIRGDLKTIRNHQKALRKFPSSFKLYNYITNHIKKYYNEDN